MKFIEVPLGCLCVPRFFVSEDEEGAELVEGAVVEEDLDNVSSAEGLCQTMENAETDVELAKQLVESQEAHDMFGPPDDVPDIEVCCDSDVEQEPPAKEKKDAMNYKTLMDVLLASGYAEFVPGPGDDQQRCLQRLRLLAPHAQSLNSTVRAAEGILSKASLRGFIKSDRPHCHWEAELARARTDFQCSAARVSRFSLWAGYSEKVFQALEPTDEGDDCHEGAVVVKGFTPNSFPDPSGKRPCQLLVVRPFYAGGASGSMRLAVVLCAFRGGQSRQKKPKQYVFARGTLPISSATVVHVRLLTPENTQDSQNRELCLATGFSPVIKLDAHDGGIVFEVPQSCFEYEYSQDCLKVWLERKTVRAISKVAKAQVPFKKAKDEEGQTSSKTYFGEEHFGKNATGNKNIQIYAQQMLRDYEVHFKPLLQENGTIQLKHDLLVPWEEILARLANYFKKYHKGSNFFKDMSKEFQMVPCPGWLILDDLGQVRFSLAVFGVICFFI